MHTYLTYYLEEMKASQVSLFGWTETNTDWLNPVTKEECRERSIRAMKSVKCEFSLSEQPSTSDYKTGGMAMGITGKCGGQAEQDLGKDPLVWDAGAI
jgi:hypothetical protein